MKFGSIKEQCSNNSTSAQESGSASPSPDSKPEALNSSDSAKSTNGAASSCPSDTPESPTTEMCEASQFGTSEKATISTLSRLPPLANPFPSKENAEEQPTSETVSPPSNEPLNQSGPDTSASRMSPDSYPAKSNPVLTRSISIDFLSSLPGSGTMRNGELWEVETSERPSDAIASFGWESPGAMSSTGKGRPPGQSRLEAQLRKAGVLSKTEVLNPRWLEMTYEIPLDWTNPSESRAATELLGLDERHSETPSTPESPPSPSGASSTSKAVYKGESSSMQLELFDLDGKKREQKADIRWIRTSELVPHPDNPRLFIKEDVYAAIVQSIAEVGFQPCYALLVRPIEEGYQIVSGQTRHKAAVEAGCLKVPCWIKPMTDEEAFFELVKANAQGELSPLEVGIHALKYVEMSQVGAGRGNKGGLSEYAVAIGRERTSLSKYRDAAKIVQHCTILELENILDKANHLAAIHKSPEQYWQQLTELLIENQWSVRETEEVVKGIKDIDIPEHFHYWLNPDKYIKQTISEALSGNGIRTPRDLRNWITTVQERLDSLPDSRKVFVVDHDEDREEIDYLNLKEEFLNRLPDLGQGDKKPSSKKIKELAAELLDWVERLDQSHAEWVASKASEEEQRKAQEAKERELLKLQNLYTPEGINALVESLTPSDIGTDFDAIITDIPYLLSNGGTTVRSGKEVSVNKNFEDKKGECVEPKDYLPLFYQILKPGGYFVTTCTIHVLMDVLNTAQSVGFEFRQKLVWFKRNSPPHYTADRFKPDYEDILIFVKPGATPYFGYEEIKLPGDKQRGAVIDIPQCGGSERLGWHDTQKPEALYEILIKAYCPPEGRVFEPFAGTGTTAAVCKRLGRICTYVEKDVGFFDKCSDRVASTPFHFIGSDGEQAVSFYSKLPV